MKYQNHHLFLKELVEIPSVYPNEHQLADFCIKKLNHLGFKVDIVEIEGGRKNLLAKKGQGNKTTVFYGHIDTVPLVDEKLWLSNPFKLTEKDGKYYGLGASDMKGGIASFLDATREYNGYLKILLTVDEENISEGAWEVIRQRLDFFKDVELIIAAESAFNTPLNTITNGRTGRVVYQALFEGKAEHIINYKKAKDAIELLGRFTDSLYNKREKLFNSPRSVAQIRKVEGESVGMSVCARSSAEIEVLLGDTDSIDSARYAIQSLTDEGKINLKQRKTPYLSGYSFDSFPHLELLKQIVKKHTRKDLILVQRSSVGDENVFASLGIPVITWGPSGGNEHRSNEYIEIKSLDRTIAMYKDFLRSIHN